MGSFYFIFTYARFTSSYTFLVQTFFVCFCFVFKCIQEHEVGTSIQKPEFQEGSACHELELRKLARLKNVRKMNYSNRTIFEVLENLNYFFFFVF